MLSVASVAVNLGLRLINGDLGWPAAHPDPSTGYFLPVRMVADFHATLDGKQAGKRCNP